MAVDFSEVAGHEVVKRALTVALAGAHSTLLIGPRGYGKTMLVKCIPGILPDGMFISGLRKTSAKEFKNGLQAAKKSVLILDDLPEFSRGNLDLLRKALEDNNLFFIATMDSCPCGYMLHHVKPCECSMVKLKSYYRRVRDITERIHIHVEVTQVHEKHFLAKRRGTSSADIEKHVDFARDIQMRRAGHLNAFMTAVEIERFAHLDEDSARLMVAGTKHLGLSPGVIRNIKKVARTIADLQGTSDIVAFHMAEAIQYRALKI